LYWFLDLVIHVEDIESMEVHVCTHKYQELSGWPIITNISKIAHKGDVNVSTIVRPKEMEPPEYIMYNMTNFTLKPRSVL